jgi:hypothetical protein
MDHADHISPPAVSLFMTAMVFVPLASNKPGDTAMHGGWLPESQFT